MKELDIQGATVAPKSPDTYGRLTLTAVPAKLNSLKGVALSTAGALTEGDYECMVMTNGCNVIDVNLRASAVTGSVAPTLRTKFHDKTIRDSDAGVDLVGATNQELSLEELRGQTRAYVAFTVGAGESVTFDRGEYNIL